MNVTLPKIQHSASLPFAGCRFLPIVEIRKKILLCLGISASVSALMGLMVSSSSASLELLSDMDCVVEPSATIELGSAVPGLLAESYYDRSDFVSEGTLVARLESNVERVSYSIAEHLATSHTAVKLRTLTAQFGDRTRSRNQKLLKTSSISQQVMDQVTTEAEIGKLQLLQEQESRRLAELELDRAKAALDRREIRSPITGTIVKRYKGAGEYVDGEPVYQIARLDPLHVEVIVPVDQLGIVQAGTIAAVNLDVPGFRNEVLSAVVRRIDAVADAASGTYGVQLTLDNPDLSIPSGVRCQVDFLAS